MHIVLTIVLALVISATTIIVFHWKQAKAELPTDAPLGMRLSELYKRLGTKPRPVRGHSQIR